MKRPVRRRRKESEESRARKLERKEGRERLAGTRNGEDAAIDGAVPSW